MTGKTNTSEEKTNKRELKYIEGRQHVFVCEDLTPLRYKLLKYMQKSCSHTFNRITHITFYTQSKRRLLTIVHYSLYKISSFTLGMSAA